MQKQRQQQHPQDIYFPSLIHNLYIAADADAAADVAGKMNLTYIENYQNNTTMTMKFECLFMVLKMNDGNDETGFSLEWYSPFVPPSPLPLPVPVFSRPDLRFCRSKLQTEFPQNENQKSNVQKIPNTSVMSVWPCISAF